MLLNSKLNNLNKQVFVYSLDTSAFYSEAEQKIHNKLMTLYLQRSDIKKKLKADNSDELKDQRKEVNKRISELKDGKLFNQFSRHKGIRKLREDAITFQVKDKDGKPTGERKERKKVIISMFESALTRTLGIKTSTLSRDIIIVQQFFSDVMEDIVKNGFEYDGHKYIYFSSSAGQIRKKKCVFIRKSVWDTHKDSLMCGLTIDKINEIGANHNKLLAYLSLQDSASTLFEGFDIDRMIVVDDWEYLVVGEVAYIDSETFNIERRTTEIPMNIADGAGMCLPSVSKLSFQFRSPWCKGLISPMDFRGWARENKCTEVVDIWGTKYDIVQDKIEIMITKSMFKMWNHYKDWQQYKDVFKKHNCTAGVCQLEAESFGNVRLGYQMLQSLNETTDDELLQISHKTVEDIKRLGKDKGTMLRLLGATKENRDKNWYQQALVLYPEMLNDNYSRKMIKDTKASMVKGAKSGRVEVLGKYLFVIPDWTAYLEWLLKGNTQPKGLIEEREVYSSLFSDKEKVDIMRSPSLYREHGIRVNKIDDEKKKWLTSKGVYVGYKDLLGKLLMMDFDGDQLFVVNHPVFVDVAERHMNNIVPLHYEMKKAPTGKVDNDSIWNGLKTAFKANIGEISNKISICWNRTEPNLNVIAWMTYLNNVEIDFAKTEWRPKVPEHVQKEIKANTKGKLPHFFICAKDKPEPNVQPVGKSTVDRLAEMIPSTRIHFKNVCGKFDYTMLMSNRHGEITLDQSVICAYKAMDLKKWRMSTNSKQDKSDDSLYVYTKIREEILNIFPNYDMTQIVDMLIEYLYKFKKSDFKVTLWNAFGDVIVENIKRNLGRYKNCEDCCEEFEGAQNAKLCLNCAKKRQKEAKTLYKQKEDKRG